MFQFSFKFPTREDADASLPGAANGEFVNEIQAKVNELLTSMGVEGIEWEFMEGWEQPSTAELDLDANDFADDSDDIDDDDALDAAGFASPE